jgi:hypothetical protein
VSTDSAAEFSYLKHFADRDSEQATGEREQGSEPERSEHEQGMIEESRS